MNFAHVLPVFFVVGIIVVIYVLFGAFFFRKAIKKDKARISTLFKSSEGGLSEEYLILEMAESYDKKGNKEKAIEYYDLYLYKLKTPDPEIMFRIGNLYGMEAYDKAMEYWKKAADMGYKQAQDIVESVKVKG